MTRTPRPAAGGHADATATPDPEADRGFATLSEPACWELLPDSGIGRLAWAAPDGRILVIPINYGRDGRTVIVRTGDAEFRHAARAGTRFAFQVEDLEPGLRSGWTLLFDGTFSEVVEDDLADRIARLVDPSLREPRPYVLLLTTTRVTGRSLHTAGDVQLVEPADEGA